MPVIKIFSIKAVGGNFYGLIVDYDSYCAVLNTCFNCGIAKKDFLDFVISPSYVGITRKSQEHLLDFIKLGIVDKGGQRL